MSNIKEFICNNNLIYTYIWYYINGEGSKTPINEYNSLEKEKCIERLEKQNNNLKKIMIKPRD